LAARPGKAEVVLDVITLVVIDEHLAGLFDGWKEVARVAGKNAGRPLDDSFRAPGAAFAKVTTSLPVRS
jgi:hypothetical protein